VIIRRVSTRPRVAREVAPQHQRPFRRAGHKTWLVAIAMQPGKARDAEWRPSATVAVTTATELAQTCAVHVDAAARLLHVVAACMSCYSPEAHPAICAARRQNDVIATVAAARAWCSHPGWRRADTSDVLCVPVQLQATDELLCSLIVMERTLPDPHHAVCATRGKHCRPGDVIMLRQRRQAPEWTRVTGHSTALALSPAAAAVFAGFGARQGEHHQAAVPACDSKAR
jgi:hypothetical protein